MPKVRVAILEDHLGIIDSYKQRLGPDPDIEIVAWVGFGEELEPMLQSREVDVLLLDLEVKSAADNSNPFPTLYLVPKLLQRHKGLRILIISGHSRSAFVNAAIAGGATGYVLKNDWYTFESLPAVVKLVNAGSLYLSKEAREQMQAQGSDVSLSDRELEALSFCVAYPGESTGSLAKRMHISGSAMRSLLSSAYQKLEVPNKAAAVAKATRLGLLVHGQASIPIP